MATWVWSYNGFSFGDGTDIDVVAVDGIGLPAVRSSDVDRLGGHGSHPGRDLLAGRRLTFELELLADDDADLAAQLAAVAAATAPRDDELPLVFQLPGEVAKQVYARPRRRDLPVDLRYLYQFPTLALQFDASDPLIYAEGQRVALTTAPQPSVGRTYSRVHTWAYGATGAGGSMFLANQGTAPTSRWEAFIGGPCVNPTLIGPGGTLTFVETIAAGAQLVLDGRNRIALLNGTASRAPAAGSVWFEIPPGGGEVRFTTADAPNGGVLMTWRDAWW